MNIVLSCYARKGRASFVVERGGRVVYSEVFVVRGDGKVRLKEYIFESIIKGLKYVRGMVSHEDLLLIGVQNTHVAEWLNGQKEYKGYETYLDDVFSIIESLDCRYLFSNTGVKKAKDIIDNDIVKEELEGTASLFASLG